MKIAGLGVMAAGLLTIHWGRLALRRAKKSHEVYWAGSLHDHGHRCIHLGERVAATGAVVAAAGFFV